MPSPLHKPLPEDSIRVLKLQGLCLVDIPDKPGVQDFAIKCSLVTVPLLDSDETSTHPDRAVYTALSYVWGNNSPGFCRYAFCDGVVLPITINLFDALRQLVLGNDPETSIIWVDAICINQNDDEEKSRQVGLMARIFAYATKVLVWLTAGTDIYGSMVRLEDFCKYMSGESDRLPDSHANSEALKYIRGHDWLQRAWTFQEIVMAKRAVLQVGRYQFRWDDICVLFSGEDVFQTIQNCRASHGSDSLLTLIGITWHRQATNQRDKIYSLLGAYRSPFSFEIDYTRSANRVYFDALSRISHDLSHLVFPALLGLEYITGNASRVAGLHGNIPSGTLGSQSEEAVDRPYSWEREMGRGKSWRANWYQKRPYDWDDQLELALNPHEKPFDFSRYHASWTMKWQLRDPLVVVSGALLGVIEYGSRYGMRSLYPLGADCMSSYGFRVADLIATDDPTTSASDRMREYDRRGNLSSHDFWRIYIERHRKHECDCHTAGGFSRPPPRPAAHKAMYLAALFGAKHLMVLQPCWDPDTQSGTFQVNARFPREHELSQLFLSLDNVEDAETEPGRRREKRVLHIESMILVGDVSSLNFIPMDFTLQ